MRSTRTTVRIKTNRGRQARLVAEIGYGEVAPVTLRMSDLQSVMVTGGPIGMEPQVLDCTGRVSIEPDYAVLVLHPLSGWKFTTAGFLREMFDEALGQDAAVYLDDRRWRTLPAGATRRDALLRDIGWRLP